MKNDICLSVTVFGSSVYMHADTTGWYKHSLLLIQMEYSITSLSNCFL